MASNAINLSDIDLGRQAVDPIRGYVYQFYQSLLAWLRLQENEILFLELAEDYTILKDNLISQTQVKDTKNSGKITLRSDAVISLIESHCRLQAENPQKMISSGLITTSAFGQEQGLVFPNEKSGLSYWRIAAREGNDVDPIRKALLAINLSEPVKTFVRDASPTELRDRIIRPIKWIASADDLSTLQGSVRDALVILGDRKRVPTTESERAEFPLIGELIRVIVKEIDKGITYADLLRAFDRATFITLPHSSIADALSNVPTGSTTGSVASSMNFVSTLDRIPLLPRFAERSDLIVKLSHAAAQKGFLWLHGSSGLGKTTIAQLIAQHREKWLFVDLRNCEASEVQGRIDAACSRLAKENAIGVVIDDYPAQQHQAATLSLCKLCLEARLHDATIITTSYLPPEPDLIFRLDADMLEVVEAPYLTLSDVEQLVIAEGGDPAVWAKVIYISCGSGHPQLVNARILGLKRRQWPQSELMADLFVPGGSSEVAAQREAVARRLIAELSNDQCDLLYRLSILIGAFDRELVLSVGNAETKIARCSEVFLSLIGPWIEARGEDRYVISPLINDSGIRNLGPLEQSAVRQTAVKNLLTRTPFPSDQLSQLFWNSFLEKDVEGLFWFTGAMLQYSLGKGKLFALMAQEVSYFAMFDLTKSLFPTDRQVAAMLRIIQCFVAIATKSGRIGDVYQQALSDCRDVSNRQISAGLLVMLICKTVMHRHATLPPTLWMSSIDELGLVLKTNGSMFHQILRNRDSIDSPPLEQFLFVFRASSLSSVDELVELFSVLDNLPPERRNWFIEGFEQCFPGPRMSINSAWLTESKRGTLNGVDAAEKYSSLAAIAERWGKNELAIDCLCAQVIMLDEYAHKDGDALAIVEAATVRHPLNYKLFRRKQTILYRRGEHKDSLQAFTSIVDAFPAEENVDKAYSMRDAGKSSGEVGEFPQAVEFFKRSADAALQVGNDLLPMAAGLLADAAYAEFVQGQYREALILMLQAVRQLSDLDPDSSSNAKYCAIILGHLVLWMRQNKDKSPFSGLSMVPGACSNPDPDPEILERQTPPRLLVWYQLAELESDLGLRVGIREELRVRSHGQQQLIHEAMLAEAIITNSCINTDADSFLEELPSYLEVMPAFENMPDPIQNDEINNPTICQVKAADPNTWHDDAHGKYFFNAVIRFCLFSLKQQRGAVINDLARRLNELVPIDQESSRFLSFLDGSEPDLPTDTEPNAVAACIATCLNIDNGVNATRAIYVTCQLWSWLQRSRFRQDLEDFLAERVSTMWVFVITHGRFMLANATQSVPAIEAALASPARGTLKLAQLALAADSGVSPGMHWNFRKIISEFAAAENSDLLSSAN